MKVKQQLMGLSTQIGNKKKTIKTRIFEAH